ncbi:centromere protein H [Perognathus longimembris pacificus]|uniref:centromere protein H n=1 Tax=Perognathus longimembris pacificus TaxID=214514 RepID=UPI002019DAAB|nr:centromere protein H [Perognathus longimembris pacificus]
MEPPPPPAEPADLGEASGTSVSTPTPGAPDAGGENRISLLLRLRAQTKQQLLEYKSMLGANEEKTPEQVIQEKEIERKIEELENEIQEAKLAFEIKCLTLGRMQFSDALKKNLEKEDTKDSVLTDDMKHILKLSKLIMKSQQESWELEAKLIGIRKKRLQLKQASEKKLSEIQTEHGKQQKDLDSMKKLDKIMTMQQILTKEIEITTVIQHVFQSLIVGSKANWAKDSNLRKLILQFEKNLTMM